MQGNFEIIADNLKLPEAPHWDERTKSLYFVDIFGQNFHRYVPETQQHTSAFVVKNVSFIIPIDGTDDKFLSSIDLNIVEVTWDGVSPEVSKVNAVAELDSKPEKKENRISDGKADPTGKLWTGTMGPEPPAGQRIEADRGTIYSIGHNKKVKSHVDKIHVSNGLGWSVDHTKFYFIDTAKGTIDQFDYNKSAESISNRQNLFTVKKHNLEGFPDGLTVDSEGNLWVALFNGSKIIKIDSRQPESLLAVLEIPTKQVTSVAFGGNNLDELYVTTANIAMGENTSLQLNKGAGAVYRVTGITGAKGLPGVGIKF